MATDLPNGPHPLDAETVARLVGKRPGAYMLTRHDVAEKFYVSYVGRSDGDLQDRLGDHVLNGRYTHFKFGHTMTDNEAFNLECRLFHDYGGEQMLDNKIHPARPAGLAALLYSKCPGCSKLD